MNEKGLRELLAEVRTGRVDVEEALSALRHMPFEDIGTACIDHHRGLRRGHPEVIFAQGKRASDILAIMEVMWSRGDDILVTRLSEGKAAQVLGRFPGAAYHERAGALTLSRCEPQDLGRGAILVIGAGTSDIPVAEEAAVTARFLGNRVEVIHDLGVAGIHRVLAHKERISQASVIIVAAGMEGALPSVVAGLVSRPVIAVPTSVGYGASFGGIAALLGMLNSCAAGVTVVNIDNGFGAGYAASLINRGDGGA
ncbi:MAG: nickel pincer cofactor biosynthesis protein LarB [Desulfobacteraceae bacterium]